jgi:hypothetical protein
MYVSLAKAAAPSRLLYQRLFVNTISERHALISGMVHASLHCGCNHQQTSAAVQSELFHFPRSVISNRTKSFKIS